MKPARKWNFKTRKYVPIEIPDTCKTYSDDMDEIITCPICNKSLKFGDGYTSRTIHTGFGIGYTVCNTCYEAEYREERKYENNIY